MIRLVIDDERTHAEGGLHARSSKDGAALLSLYKKLDELWLDHDLGFQDTIMPVVALLEELAFNEKAPQIGTVYVHTQNPVGAQNIIRDLHRHYNVKRVGVENFVDC